jgi:hypothetical protein
MQAKMALRFPSAREPQVLETWPRETAGRLALAGVAVYLVADTGSFLPAGHLRRLIVAGDDSGRRRSSWS